MNMRSKLLSAVLLATMASVALLSACAKKPAKPQLTLSLARTQWRIGEPLWYRLEMKNVGGQPMCVGGWLNNFWVDQMALEDNYRKKRGTYLKVLDSAGKEVPLTFYWGMHGEFRFWTDGTFKHPPKTPQGLIYRGLNTIADHLHPVFFLMGFADLLQSFRRETYHCAIELMPGQSVTASESIVAPIRMNGQHIGLSDARIPPTATKAERDAYEKLWKIQAQDLGVPYDRFDPYHQPKPIPDHRILEGINCKKPGKYRIVAVYDTFKELLPISAEETLKFYGIDPSGKYGIETIREWQEKTPGDLDQLRQERLETEEFNKNKAVHLESNAVEFEIAP